VVVRRRVGEKGAERGRGLGPWIEAVSFREEVVGIMVVVVVGEVEEGGEEEGISR
jgi:hypothetical protein